MRFASVRAKPEERDIPLRGRMYRALGVDVECLGDAAAVFAAYSFPSNVPPEWDFTIAASVELIVPLAFTSVRKFALVTG